MAPPLGSKRKSVAFDDDDDDDNYKRLEPKPHGPLKKKGKKSDHTNDDELDDIDEWDEEEEYEGNVDETAKMAKERNLLEAKRIRRLKRNIDSDDEGEGHNTHIDHQTSLAAEGIEIEPFHMENEENDGTGYFDGDTYVFRKRQSADEEPDAWLENLNDSEVPIMMREQQQRNDTDETNNDDNANPYDNWSVEELYGKIMPLVSDTETIMQAIIRYGNLLKANRIQKSRHNNKQKSSVVNDETQSDRDKNNIVNDNSINNANTANLAQSSLNELTTISNALLLKGKVDVYQKTRTDIEKLLQSSSSKNKSGKFFDSTDDKEQSRSSMFDSSSSDAPSTGSVKWEYQGQDRQIHGPFTTEQMIGWISAGYFVGPSAVYVRTIRPSTNARLRKQSQDVPSKSIQEDLLSDLMNDNDNDDELNVTDERKVEDNLDTTNYGEWILSDQVNFRKYS